MKPFLLFVCIGGAALAACVTASGAIEPARLDAGILARDANGSSTATDATTPPSVDATSADAAMGDAGPVFAKIACGAPLPGVPLDPDLVEAQAGFAAELSSTDTSKLPNPYVYSAENRSVQGLINYMLDRRETAPLAHADARTGMARSVLAAAARGSAGRLDLVFLRRGLHHFYTCEQGLPASLSELVHRYGRYDAWESETLECAAPKDGPRRIRRSADGSVLIAETLQGTAVRETEVLFAGLRADGNLAFAVYTPEGDITDRSTFATPSGVPAVLAAPVACMSCHTSTVNGVTRYTSTMPTGTGAGCF